MSQSFGKDHLVYGCDNIILCPQAIMVYLSVGHDELAVAVLLVILPFTNILVAILVRIGPFARLGIVFLIVNT
jgi:hypothetical protein